MRFSLVVLLLNYAFLSVAFAQSNPAFNTYYASVEAKGAGVWVEQPYIYFVSEVACLNSKKYSGTQESKQATFNILKMIEKSLLNNAIEKQLPSKVVAAKVAFILRQKHNAVVNSFSATGSLIEDKDIGNCTRRRVMAFSYDSYANNENAVGKIDISAIAQQVVEQELTTKDMQFLTQYADELNLKRLSLASDNKINKYVVDALPAINQTLSAKQGFTKHINYLNAEIKRRKISVPSNLNVPLFKQHDVATIFSDLIDSQGFLNFHSPTPAQRDIATQYYDRAKVNYDAGLAPSKIIEDLSVSLRFNANQESALNMLGSLAQAFGEYESALILHTRALMVDPFASRSLIHIAKAHLALERTNTAQNYINFVLNHYPWLTQNQWAISQAQSLSKEINNAR